MKYAVVIPPRVQRSIELLPKNVASRVLRAIVQLRERSRPEGCAKLAGHVDIYRLRIGDYRVVYQIKDRALLVLIVRVAHRRIVYRNL